MTDLDKLFNEEIAALNAACDAKEAALDAHGYGGKAPVSPEQIIGLGGFVPAAARLIERYVRAQVAIGWLGNPEVGHIELGMGYEDGERPSAFRSKLIEVAQCGFENVFRDLIRTDGERWPRGGPGENPLDENIADTLTRDIDKRIVGLWGDRPRFIEVWRGDDDDEPLTQVYAPHGMPRWR